MTDNEGKQAAYDAAEALLDACYANSDSVLEAAKARAGAGSPTEYEALIRLEIVGSMCFDRLMVHYVRRVMAEVLALEDQSRAGEHMMQAVVNPIVGGVIAFVDDMDDAMRNTFLAALRQTMDQAVEMRMQNKAARGKGRGH